MDNFLDINETTRLSTNNYDVKVVVKYGDYYYIKLENEQSFVTDGKKIYETSHYGVVQDVFFLGKKLCAVCSDYYGKNLVDLDSKMVIFGDENINDITRVDDHILYVSNNFGSRTLYNIDIKKYLYEDSDYRYMYSLGNGFYMFEETESLHDNNNLKHRVVDSNGKIVFDNIDGYPDIKDNHLIISKKDTLRVLTFNNGSISENIIEKGSDILAKPLYVDGKIILVEKGAVRFYSLEKELLQEIKIDELNFVVDSEYVNSILKLCVAPNEDDEAPRKHVFLNVKSGKYISNFRIEGYPYWTPKCFVGFEEINDPYKVFEEGVLDKTSKYHFYDSEFNEFACIEGNRLMDINLEDLFYIQTWNGNGFDNTFVNASSQVVKKCIYDSIIFKSSAVAGCAISDKEDKIDLVDLNLNVLVNNVHEKIDFGSYHIWDVYFVNGYVALLLEYHDFFTRYRSVIFSPDGEVLKDSDYRIFPLDNTMIFDLLYKKTLFLDTKTGEIKPLTITAKEDPNTGLIDFDAINNVRKLLPDNDLLNLDSQDGVKKRIKSLD